MRALLGACTGLLHQLRALSSSTAAAAAAAAPEAAAGSGDAGGQQAGRLVKMNLCTAVNDALHIAMASDPK